MSIKVEFTGYVNKVRTYDWGVAYDVAHNQMQKKGEQWEVIGRDFLSVVGPEGTELFAENDMVEIKGTLKTKVFDKQDGSKGIALNVRAEQMSRVATKRGGAPAKSVAPAEPVVHALWPEATELADAPF